MSRIADVEVVGPHTLAVTRQGDGRDIVDIIESFGPFAPLRDPEAFAEVRLMGWGDGIEWPALGLDYSADSLAALAGR